MPFELLNKKFRATQKILDKDIAGIVNTVEELNSPNTSRMQVDDVVKMIDTVTQKTSNLKRKVIVPTASFKVEHYYVWS